jgi:thiaminase
MYLETCARLKMTAVAATPNFKDLETFEFRHNSSIEYIAKLKEICITMLGISESTLESTPRSVQLDASERFYKDSLRNEDALLGFVSICIRLLRKQH